MSGTIEQQILALQADIADLGVQLAATTNPSDFLAIEAQITADNSQILTLTLELCFLHGTKILTDRGEVAIEDLAVGDLVVTSHGPAATMPIRWIGRQRFEGETAKFAQPVLVRAGALGEGLPHRDLRLAGDHCLHLEGRLVPVKLLINGKTILTERGHATVDYINIELDQHGVVMAEGVEAETYLDCGNRFRFDNAAEASDWVSSRPAGTDAAWHDGTAFALPLWNGPKLDALVARIAHAGAEGMAIAA